MCERSERDVGRLQTASCIEYEDLRRVGEAAARFAVGGITLQDTAVTLCRSA